MKEKILKDRIKFFILGALVTLGLMTVMGLREKTEPRYGRYQISAWGANGAYGAFVIDTATGETKVVYESDTIEDRRFLDRPFHSAKK
ncbi:MAG: hypothetical protein JRF59_15720 [Deltaproteobacteria bacterium]|mgnify:CR=1 FL=1|nr:hypothetical protein [Deltaproteobacteria bacterium]MBW1925559.1 hypothetical protein [Deltaproteobacteria bacterium]MBW1951350.1 hypothetical protein [Deltaproteobacteria bacterium]MBW2009922.1 hypothetical protein [Deltaproteobacteria bacterium]MBW2103247.1 hypothetical protein [Deltaproteobacteria bacterium]